MASASDDFNRADVSPLGGNWQIMYGDGHQIISNAVAAVDATGATISAWSASHTNFTDNQRSRITLSANSSPDFPGAAVRMLTTGGGQGYFVRAVGGTELVLYKVVAGVPEFLAEYNGLTITASSSFSIEAIGDGTSTELFIELEDVLVDSYVDSTSPLTGGQPGIYYDYQNTNASRITAWSAEDDAAAPGSTTVTPAQATLTLNGRAPTMNPFSAVVIRDTLINEAGSVVANATGITALIWRSSTPSGAPDQTLASQTSNASGSISWNIATGALTYNSPITFFFFRGSPPDTFGGGVKVPDYDP